MNNMILKSRYMLITIACLLLVFFINSDIYAGKIELPEGQEIKVAFDSTMKISSGSLTSGIPLLIHLVEPIEVGDIIIVEKGAPGTATVSEVVMASKPGKPGKIKVEFTELEVGGEYKTPEESKIQLSGTLEKEGKGKKLLSFIFGFGLLIKGGQAEIKVDTVYTAIIKEPIILEQK
jgi:hypothetical protein